MILGAVAIATLLITWATGSHAISKLFDTVISQGAAGMTVRHRFPHRRGGGTEGGQATVEFAFLLPLVVFAALAVIQIGLVVRDQMGVVHAAREAARAASVDADTSRAVRGRAPHAAGRHRRGRCTPEDRR